MLRRSGSVHLAVGWLALTLLLGGAAAGAEFRHASGADDVVARLTIRSGERPGARMLTVYGSGRVHAHYPAYLKNAGDREIQLSPAELDALLRQLTATGLPEFDAAAVKAECAAIEAGRGELRAAPGADWIELELNLDAYRRGAADAPRDVRQRVVWRGLPQDVARFPEVEALGDLKAAQAALRALLARPDLAGRR